MRLCEREGVREASENLGVPLKSLYAWRREERLERGEAPKGLRPGETPEQGVTRLERESAAKTFAVMMSSVAATAGWS